MTPKNIHIRTRQLIQLELDGWLSEREAARLAAHLKECGACQTYAAELRQLNAALRLDAHLQRETAALKAQASPNPTAGFALSSYPKRKRAVMSTNFWKSFASTVVSVALLAGMVGGLIWLLSSALPQAAPQQLEATPTLPPAPTATPTPTPLPPVGSREQIIAVLTSLAERDAGAYQQGTFWAYQVSQDMNEEGSGVISSAYAEEWRHIVDGKCEQSLSIYRDRPQGEQFYNLMIGLADGTYGDLIELRRGVEVGPGSLRTDWNCEILPTYTDAGVLAGRLKTGPDQMLIKGPNEVKDLKAWFETLENRPVLVVEALFTGAGNIPEVQRVEQRFDVDSGRMFMERAVAEWEDGRPFGETSRSKSTQFVPELPEETARLFEQASQELLTYLNPANHPTATPFPTVEPGFLDGLTAYSDHAPLTQPVTILQVLQVLLQRHTEWVKQPGWVLHQPRPFEGQKWDMTYSILMHALPDGNCDQLIYYIKDGRVLPNRIDLANGDWGFISAVEEGAFTEGKAGDMPCHSQNYYTIGLLQANIDFIQSVVQGESHQSLKMWVDVRQNRPTLVLYSDEMYTDPQPMGQDPDTGQLERMERSQMWTFFDLQSGAFAGANTLSHFANGKIFGDEYQPGGTLPLETIRMETLPPDLAQAFEQAQMALKEYLGQQP